MSSSTSASPIRIVVSGAGKMGREVLAAVCREPGLDPVGVLEKFSRERSIALPSGEGAIPMSDDPQALFASLPGGPPDVLIDFTNAEWTERVAPLAVAAGVRPVIGTTGLSPAFVDRLDAECRARGIGGVVTANFAIGAVLLMHLASVAARFFDYAEIIELHHEAKVDAPSGTALQTVRAMREARSRPFELPETERETLPGTRGGATEGVSIHSVRLPGFVAHQEVIFGALGQTLTLRHDSTSRESFMPGVLLAVRAAMERVGVARGLDELLGLR